MAISSIEFNADAALKTLKDYPQRTERATIRSLNRALTSGRALLARLIAKDMGLKVGVTKEAIKVTQAKPGRLQVELRASLKRLPLIDFRAKGPGGASATNPVPSRGRGRGVTYRIGVRGRQRLPHAFIAQMPTGHIGVFERATKARLKIIEKRAVSIGHVFDVHRETGIAKMREVFATNLEHELAFAASQVNAGA